MKKSRISQQVRLDLPVTQHQLVSLHLALMTVNAGGLSDNPDCFPSRADLACLKQLDERVWTLLTSSSRAKSPQRSDRIGAGAARV